MHASIWKGSLHLLNVYLEFDKFSSRKILQINYIHWVKVSSIYIKAKSFNFVNTEHCYCIFNFVCKIRKKNWKWLGVIGNEKSSSFFLLFFASSLISTPVMVPKPFLGYRTITGGSNNKVQFIVLVHKYVGVNSLTWLNLRNYYCYDALSQSHRSLLLLKRALLLLTRTFLSSI